ncbi:LacI family DNA-binding transcriptional regulator [Novosphingobium sp. Fuku2-ISO-50]|jgi:DNA-binding LacI/PurR family transcriptional regulator|uniref:LacI family DNA-binding transcriptional regulator n=1 Tax=Novosphingobium sp. Fuku2-ISO-50 TaxID=1739114 RepID=UPI00076DB731|nr:substrate-binding domain-containing protein [Novosphingobium sp. Fuku2-ISO-50]KUR78403.1 LacI family transcriptional regulator [Novosphingobium sp. Fuku2-ISO-50]
MPEKRPENRIVRVTSFDVAEAAGVSQSTVSRALAGDTSISEPTRKRVTEAALRLNYQVDENAARLRRGRTGTLALVMICRHGQDRKDLNPFYFALLGSTCAAAAARGYEVLVAFQDSPANFWGRYQERRKADGMIVIGTSENTEAWDYFGTLGEGTNWVCWGAPSDDFPWVRSDNHAGAMLATRHMLVHGYRNIVCLGSETSPQRQFKERYDGYADAMRDAGLEPFLQRIERGQPREEQGRLAAAALVESGRPFDGIFGVSDEIALGALKELASRGYRIPEDVGVVGFDGVRAGAWSAPPLTTVESDFEVAGSLLVDRLIATIGGEAPSPRRVPVRLVVRGSTRP